MKKRMTAAAALTAAMLTGAGLAMMITGVAARAQDPGHLENFFSLKRTLTGALKGYRDLVSDNERLRVDLAEALARIRRLEAANTELHGENDLAWRMYGYTASMFSRVLHQRDAWETLVHALLYPKPAGPPRPAAYAAYRDRGRTADLYAIIEGLRRANFVIAGNSEARDRRSAERAFSLEVALAEQQGVGAVLRTAAPGQRRGYAPHGRQVRVLR